MDGSWASRYFELKPRRFKVIKSGPPNERGPRGGRVSAGSTNQYLPCRSNIGPGLSTSRAPTFNVAYDPDP